jgi:hypothetical protein
VPSRARAPVRIGCANGVRDKRSNIQAFLPWRALSRWISMCSWNRSHFGRGEASGERPLWRPSRAQRMPQQAPCGDTAMIDLSGGHIVVPGGSSGSGRAVARLAATLGARPTLLGRSTSPYAAAAGCEPKEKQG